MYLVCDRFAISSNIFDEALDALEATLLFINKIKKISDKNKKLR